MQNTVINFKTEEKLKKEALKVAKRKGVSLDVLVNDYLKEGIRAEKISEGLDETPNEWLKEELKKSEEDFKAGRYITFKSSKDMIDYLKKDLENDRREQSAD